MAAAAKQLWGADAAEPWQDVLASATSTWQQHAPAKLLELNTWYESDLPSVISSRAPQPHITQPELVKLVDWKLSRGKWRPRLLDFAKAAQSQDVLDASTAAFGTLLNGAPQSKKAKAPKQQQPDAPEQQQQQQPSAAAIEAALTELCQLKGVGPATASALLAAADTSGSTPFMSDEALEAAVGSRSYTAKEYLQLVDALRAKAAWLAAHDPGTGWTAAKVEGCLYAAQLAAKPPAKAGKAKAKAPGPKAAAAAGTTASSSAKGKGQKNKAAGAASGAGGAASKRAKKS